MSIGLYRGPMEINGNGGFGPCLSEASSLLGGRSSHRSKREENGAVEPKGPRLQLSQPSWACLFCAPSPLPAMSLSYPSLLLLLLLFFSGLPPSENLTKSEVKSHPSLFPMCPAKCMVQNRMEPVQGAGHLLPSSTREPGSAAHWEAPRRRPVDGCLTPHL